MPLSMQQACQQFALLQLYLLPQAYRRAAGNFSQKKQVDPRQGMRSRPLCGSGRRIGKIVCLKLFAAGNEQATGSGNDWKGFGG